MIGKSVRPHKSSITLGMTPGNTSIASGLLEAIIDIDLLMALLSIKNVRCMDKSPSALAIFMS